MRSRNQDHNYHLVRIDKLLLDDTEALDVKHRTNSTNQRLKYMTNSAKLKSNVQLYRYHIGQHFGTYNCLWVLPADVD